MVTRTRAIMVKSVESRQSRIHFNFIRIKYVIYKARWTIIIDHVAEDIETRGG
jgi:hypothetical protein